MQFLADEITEFTKAVWSSVLESELTSVANVSDPADSGATMTAWVHISGPWNGALVLYCGLDSAQAAAGFMLQMEPGEAGKEDVADVLGELANMIGGNLKALLPEPATLGLPNVVEGKEYSMHLPGSREVTRLGFEWRGAPIVVVLVQRDGQAES